METIKELRNHLQNCSKILDKFILKYGINICYLVINDTVSINTYGSLDLKVNLEFDDFKISKVREIKRKLYEEFRTYLENNQIDYDLHIYSQYRGWAVTKIIFKFEITN